MLTRVLGSLLSTATFVNRSILVLYRDRFGDGISTCSTGASFLCGGRDVIVGASCLVL